MINQKILGNKIILLTISILLVGVPIVHHFKDTVPFLHKKESSPQVTSVYGNQEIISLLRDFVNYTLPTFPILENESLSVRPNERSENINDPIGPTELFYETPEGYRYVSDSLGFSSEVSCRRDTAAYKNRTKTMSENIDQFMKGRDFIKDEANSSPVVYFEKNTEYIEEEKFYDYRLAYTSVDKKITCVASFEPECSGGINPDFHQGFSMSCVTQEELKDAETNQVWLLKELGLKNTTINVVYENAQGDIPQEATALVDIHDVTKTPLFNYLKNETFVAGGLWSNRGGGYFIAKKIDGKFGIIFDGQDTIPCDVVEKYSIPGSVVGGMCYDYTNQKERALSP
jgi:hypothetical protein